MDPRDELLSLKEHPLPVEGDDSILPTRIAKIEEEMKGVEEEMRAVNEKLSEKLSDLRGSRNLLLDHAILIGIVEDSAWKIEKSVSFGNRVADPIKLKSLSAEKWKLYSESVRDKAMQDVKLLLQKAKDGLEKSVNLGIADKIFGKNVVDGCSTKPEMVSFKVVRKE